MLLGLLSRGEQHGYDLKQAHDDRFPTVKPLAYGQVYSTLARLQRDGLVEPVTVERVDGPDRTVFQITASGRAELAEWLQQVEEPFAYVANPRATKVTVALLAAGRSEATTYLQRQRDSHLQRMRHYTRVKTDPASSLDQQLAADYALTHLNADLDWMSTALRRVDALSKEISA